MRPQPATITRAPIASTKARMFFTSPPIHRCRGMGSISGQRGSDLQRLGLGELALDPDDNAVVVDEERVRGKAQRLVAEIAAGIDEEEDVRLAGDPVALVPVDGHLFQVGTGSE